jgi:HK97 family phage major capsid protein
MQTTVIEPTNYIYTCQRAVTAVDSVEGVLKLYVAIWGSPEQRDSYDTWWDKARPVDIGLKFTPYPLKYDHASDSSIGAETIGTVESVVLDDIGYLATARLDKGSPYFGRIISEVRKGELFTSSATAPHLAEFYDDGAFKNWDLVELTLTKHPAESRMPAVQLIRSSAEQSQDATGGDSSQFAETASHEAIREDNAMDFQAVVQQLITSGASAQDIIQALVAAGLSPDDMLAALQANNPEQENGNGNANEPPQEGRSNTMEFNMDTLKDAIRSLQAEQAQQAAEAAKAAELEALRAEKAKLEKELADTRNAPPADDGVRFASNGNGNVVVSEPRKYWGRDFESLVFAREVMRAKGIQPSEEFRRMLGVRAGQLVEKDAPVIQDMNVRSMLPSTRANEVMISTAAGAGDEWVSIAWSTSLWEKARNEARIYQTLRTKGMMEQEVPQGAESVYFLTEGADPTVYTIAQNANADATGRPSVNVGLSRAGTDRVLCTPGELGLAVAYSDVFEEDSLINVAPQLNQQINIKMVETVDQLLINGDTETGANANINLIDSTPGSGLSTPYYIASNGIRKYALVTGSSTSRNGGALDENDFRATLALFPVEIQDQLDRLVFFIDPYTHNTALDILSIKTDDVRVGGAATVTSGRVRQMYAVDVVTSGFIVKNNSAGKTPNAGGTLGQIVAAYAPYWAAAWKRQVRVETDRDILTGTNVIVAKMRLGFVPRGAGASVETYNITIA